METYSHHEDHEALMFHSWPCAYYVQSPSTVSHANSTDVRKTAIEDQSAVTLHFHSPTPSESNILNKNPDVARFTLSRYSSSRGSNNSFLHDKSIVAAAAADHKAGFNRLIIIDKVGHGDNQNDEDEDEAREGWWWRYCSFRSSNSCAWISLQICWRLVLSLGLALLVFYIATKPPPPNISIKVARVGEFGLGEAVDGSGVSTKILTCNCSIRFVVENKSKLFGLHIHPPTIDIFFGRLPFAISHGPKLYAQSSGSSRFEVYIGTRNKPMYGAGRSMQDLLDSGMGLPLLIHVKLRSNYRVVYNLLKPKFHHQAECLLLLDNKYDKKHHTRKFNSTCTFTS
ncbi:zinc finger CCCH domain-containing protein 30-like [Hibiscus syriacus]|uniref:Zinc finger CCCH domain-containing protein 30-like n=1 Tax=Hibiscus syriacus TaxID=106335 RepID=A0A6A2XNY0_HIBSY|nr:uncharacterized protein LOC120164305 [Hibiscus syriacus]KAE8677483.1 zinc finger CCCH domain-containing protein 30-like [Hibiscus syriacus]